MTVAEELDDIDYLVKVQQNSSDVVIVTYPSAQLYVEHDEPLKVEYGLLPDGISFYNYNTNIEEILQINKYLVRPIITSNIIQTCIQKNLNISLIRYYKEDGTKVNNLTEIFTYPLSETEGLLCEAAFDFLVNGDNAEIQKTIDDCGLTISFNILKGFLK